MSYMDIIAGYIPIFLGVAPLVLAVVALWIESRRSRIALQADVLFQLEEKFHSEFSRKMRRLAATKLLADDLSGVELSETLSLLTTIAHRVRFGALDEEMAYLAFEYWVIGYWHASKNKILHDRKDDPKGWGSLEWLVKRFEAIEKRESRKGGRTYVSHIMEPKLFLEGEIKQDILHN